MRDKEPAYSPHGKKAMAIEWEGAHAALEDNAGAGVFGKGRRT
jgi:hypothetical protein